MARKLSIVLADPPNPVGNRYMLEYPNLGLLYLASSLRSQRSDCEIAYVEARNWGKFTVHVRTMRKRLRRSLTAVAEWYQEHRQAPVDELQKTLNAKLRGHYQYYGRPTNSQSLLKFYRGVVRIWRKWLNRRTRGNRMTWERYIELLRRHPLLPPRIPHV